MKTIGLIAHDRMKPLMVDWVKRYHDRLKNFSLVATGTTGGLVREACPDLSVELLKSGPLGGDQQAGAMIAEARMQALIFLTDPLTAMPHDVDVKALTRLSTLDACNVATADMVIAMLQP